MKKIGVLIFALCVSLPVAAQQKLEKATFAAGCFWCTEEAFDKLPGVVSTTSGYMGGQKKHPTYEEVSAGITGHAEVVQVVYDPAKLSYERLLERSEEHTSELQSRLHLVCRLLLEKKKKK